MNTTRTLQLYKNMKYLEPIHLDSNNITIINKDRNLKTCSILEIIKIHKLKH